MQKPPQPARGAPHVPPQLGQPVVQTVLFRGAASTRDGDAFIQPVQTILAEGFPCEFDLVVLSAVVGAAKGMLGCIHEIEVDGTQILRHEHNPTPIAYEGTGICFRLELKQLQIFAPCVLIIRTALSNGARGQDVPLWVVDEARLKGPGLSLRG